MPSKTGLSAIQALMRRGANGFLGRGRTFIKIAAIDCCEPEADR